MFLEGEAVSPSGKHKYTPRNLIAWLRAVHDHIPIPTPPEGTVWWIEVHDDRMECTVRIKHQDVVAQYPNLTVPYHTKLHDSDVILETYVVHLEGVVPIRFRAILHKQLTLII